MNNREKDSLYYQTLTEQYKLYVEMSDRISQRRVQTNQFYVSVITGLMAIIAFIMDKDFFKNYINAIDIILSVFGIFLCIAWRMNIISYRKINTAKFKVIHQIEQELPFACYDVEWKILNSNKKNRYTALTNIENFLPISILIIFIFLLIVALIYH